MREKTKFDFFKVQGWDDVYEATCTTIHKKGIDGKELSPSWKKAMFKSEHSPIRELTIKFRIAEVMRWVAGQLVRSKNEHYMSTGRSDRGNVPRSEQTLENIHSLMESKNAQHIIDTSKKRLCIGCVSKETRELWEDVVTRLSTEEPELAFYCVPNCVYRNGCPETWANCSHFNNFKNYVKENSKNDDEALQILSDIDSRYDEYHSWRKGGSV